MLSIATEAIPAATLDTERELESIVQTHFWVGSTSKKRQNQAAVFIKGTSDGGSTGKTVQKAREKGTQGKIESPSADYTLTKSG